jgi:hypothetical protein
MVSFFTWAHSLGFWGFMGIMLACWFGPVVVFALLNRKFGFVRPKDDAGRLSAQGAILIWPFFLYCLIVGVPLYFLIVAPVKWLLQWSLEPAEKGTISNAADQ